MLVGAQLREHGIKAPVTIVNDADGVAAGLAATHGKLDQHDSGVDARRGHWLWPLSVCAGGVGGRPYRR